VFATTRLLAALPGTDAAFSLAFWDPVFFVWSIAATFMFALAQFINGNVLIQQEHIEALAETQRRLDRERELARDLARSNSEQQNLQKLLLHEFKRPLSALQAALQVNNRKKTPMDAHKVERLRVLTTQASTYLEGISQYQDIAELFDAPNWSLVTVSEVAQDIAIKWGVKVMVHDKLENHTIQCDPLLVDIAISNLIENAKKFSRTPAGVTVSIESVGGKLRLDVQDDGLGIPSTEWEQVWQKFYKLDTETKNALTGCGLGLYIVAEVARVHKGHASVVSTQPSVVRLELPLTENASADE
jgi:signal transduction histidine kinase